jgi:hypothetical protein
MSHWAEVDSNNIVLQVLVGDNDSPDEGEAFMKSLSDNKWIKTSFNTLGNKHLFGGTPLRGNYAQVGGTYDPVEDVFIPIKQWKSWTLNKETLSWEPPVAYPTDGQGYIWNENFERWDLANIQGA